MLNFKAFIFSFFILCFSNSHATTHWLVTEDGKIQPQMNSAFSLRRPDDLVALLAQEERYETMLKLKRELLSKNSEIKRCEDRTHNLEDQIYAKDPDCLEAGQPLVEFDLYVSTIVPFEPKLQPRSLTAVTEHLQPDCSKYMDLNFSMHAFEHLSGVRNRDNLSMSPETDLHKAATGISDIHAFGTEIALALEKDPKSWVFYNLAAYYWRERGDVKRAIECVRRALHHSPREHKDVALISLGNILHRSHLSEEAAVVLQAAIDAAPNSAICHFTLANVYAVLARYNKSVESYESTLRVQPDFRNAKIRKHAVLCHRKLEAALEAQHNSLQRTLVQLREYRRERDTYERLAKKLEAEQAPASLRFQQHVEYHELRQRLQSGISSGSAAGDSKPPLNVKGHDCQQIETEQGHWVLSCNAAPTDPYNLNNWIDNWGVHFVQDEAAHTHSNQQTCSGSESGNSEGPALKTP